MYKYLYFLILLVAPEIAEATTHCYDDDSSDDTVEVTASRSLKPTMKTAHESFCWDLRGLDKANQSGELQKLKESDWSKISLIDLSRSHLTEASFKQFTDAIQINKLSRLKVLDISSNPLLSQDIAISLLQWVTKTALPIKIVITDTAVDVKDVKLLYDALVKTGQVADAVMESLIFVKKGYLKLASEKVLVYKNYVQRKILPKDWAQTHDAFYNGEEWNALKNIKKHELPQKKSNEKTSVVSFDQFEKECRAELTDGDSDC